MDPAENGRAAARPLTRLPVLVSRLLKMAPAHGRTQVPSRQDLER